MPRSQSSSRCRRPIAIGTGGPFGAEGPIIMTGGAIGSLIAQMLPVSDNERKTLLVAGAAAGMTTVFGTPIAAIMLAVELLLFEWTPRSFIPVTVAAVVAAVERSLLHMPSPLFPFTGGVEISARSARRLGADRNACRASLRRADAAGLHLRGCFPETSDPLDVVAGDRRPGRGRWRPDRAACAERRL